MPDDLPWFSQGCVKSKKRVDSYKVAEPSLSFRCQLETSVDAENRWPNAERLIF